MTTPELLAYIRAQQEGGVSREVITASLVGAGWNPAHVEEGFVAVSGVPTNPPPVELSRPVVEIKSTTASPKINTAWQKKSHKKLINSAIGILVVLTLGALGAWYWQHSAPKRLRAAVLATERAVKTYDADLVVSNMQNNIEVMHGTIKADLAQHLIGADMTFPNLATSLMVVDPQHVYAKLTFDNTLLRDMLHLPDEWIVYDPNDTAVPGKEAGLATQSGRFGTYAFTDDRWSIPEVRDLDGKSALYLTYDMKHDDPNATGEVSLWVDAVTYVPLRMRVHSGQLELLWKFKAVDGPVVIVAPTGAVPMSEWKQKQFLSGLPKEKITSMVFHSGKGVSKDDATTAVQAIEDYYGVKAVISTKEWAAIPKDPAVYDTDRKQYNADALWEMATLQTKDAAPNKRDVYLFADDVYSAVSPGQEYVFSRALPDANVVFISLARLQSAQKNNSTSTEVLTKERITKVVVRTIGVSAGLAYTDDANRKECVMHEALTLAELDQTGTDICPIAKEAIPTVFGK